MAFAGFPRKVRFTPVPNPVFGPLLEQIDDVAELKCTLRVIWLLHQKRGFPRYVTIDELAADLVLVRALAGEAEDPGSEVRRGMALAVQRGTMLEGAIGQDGARQHVYMMNTEADRRALAELEGVEPSVPRTPGADGWERAAERPNIYVLYEDNIGMLSPMVSEELKEAEDLYPPAWIEDAFREAVTHNKRSWRYVAAILERWEREGRGDGGTGRYSKTAGYAERLRR